MARATSRTSAAAEQYNAQADLQPPALEVDFAARSSARHHRQRRSAQPYARRGARFVRAWALQGHAVARSADAGLLWAPLRKPHENALDEHWLTRKTFADIEHPELGRSFR